MGILDFIFIALWIIAGTFSYITGKDYLYKLLLWLLIGFLLYALLESQIALGKELPLWELNSYQIYLEEHASIMLTLALLGVPFLWAFFMLYKRISIETYKNSPSHIILWMILPLFVVGMLWYLSQTSILRENSTWQKIFDFLEMSYIYTVFQDFPWLIFLMLLFLISYKTLLVILISFGTWLWQDLLPQFFTSWKKTKRKKGKHSHTDSHHEDEEEADEEEDHDDHHHDSHHGGHHH